MQSKRVREHRESLSMELAGRREVRLALMAIAVSAVIFVVVVPFATKQLAHVPSFIAAYESVVVFCDLITAILLFSQSNVLQSCALFVLASGYLLKALIAFAHALVFPEAFSASGLFGGGSQNEIRLYSFWPAGFPFFVIAYALLKDKKRTPMVTSIGAPAGRGTGMGILPCIVAVVATTYGLTLVATTNQDSFLALISNNQFTPAFKIVSLCFWMLNLSALLILLRRGSYLVLDLWLIVVVCAWLFEIALSNLLNSGRFDFGWYMGRGYGLLAASFLLVVLLIESSKHDTRLARVSRKLKAANETLEQLSLKDGLTGLANRRFFDTYLYAQIAVARRYKRPLALVLCDVDFFKAYNDHYGHQAGDECLKRIATALQSCCRRPADIPARYGGEEFVIVLPDTELQGAIHIAESIRDAIAQLKIPRAHSATCNPCEH